MSRRSSAFRVVLAVTALLMAAEVGLARTQAVPGTADLVPIEWLERIADAPRASLPAFRPIQDPARAGQAERLADNEAASFVRRLIARSWRQTGAYPGDTALPALPIALEPGGNYARQGLRILREGRYVELPDVPYLLLSLDESSLSLTFLHEGGHVVDRIVRGSARREPRWSALVHSTFAVTDPLTALGEGFAIHLETLWGHYGNTPERRDWYHRLQPQWSPDRPLAGEFFAPVRDLLSFSQNWARYRSVRDCETAFDGHVYGDSYLRSQYGPARDGASLRTGNGMVASEGVVASVLFWIADGVARAGGAEPLRGLHQPAILSAEMQLVEALQRSSAARSDSRPDLIDVLVAFGTDQSTKRAAIERFVAITRGVTARPDMRRDWSSLYGAAVVLDIEVARKLAAQLDGTRREIIEAAVKDPATLRAGIGPVLPIRLGRAQVQLRALGDPFPVEFDLNAAGAAELTLLAADSAVRDKVRLERDVRPFGSYDDFEARIGISLGELGATRVEPQQPATR